MIFALAMVCLVLPLSHAAVLTGDVNGNLKVEMDDAIIALQAAANLRDDVDADLGDAVAALQILAGIQIVEGRAVLGPLSGADVKVYRLRDFETPVYTARTQTDGRFTLVLSGIASGEPVLVAVSGGTDTDADDDGIPGPSVANAGTIHALLFPGTGGEFNVTALSDIAWQYTKNLVGQVDASGLKIRLRDIAMTFFKENEDINGDMALDEKDICAFNPADAGHKGKLKFDYQDFFIADGNGDSVINCYHGNKESVLPGLLDKKFGAQLSLYPTPDSRNPEIKISLVPFGRGKVVSSAGAVSYDSERDDAQNITHDFFDKDLNQKVVLTAAPTDATKILGWKGCDSVSEDMTRCECIQDRDHEVRVSFGYKETKVVSGWVDLSRAKVTRTGDTLSVTVGADDTEMVSKMAHMTSGWFVTGTAGSGFLLKVLNVQKTDNFNYTLTTSETATLADIIQQGTGTFSRKITHGDLADSGVKRRSGVYDIQTIDGVTILPSDDPEDTVFTIQFGQPAKARTLDCDPEDMSCHWDKTVVIYETENVKLEVAGSVDLEVDVDAGVSFSLISGLEAFNFNVGVGTDEKLDIIATGAFSWDGEVSVLDNKPLPLGSAKFFVGPVPVVINFELDIFLGAGVDVSASVTTGIELSQQLDAGLVYSKGRFRPEGRFEKSFKYNPPSILENHLDINGWIRPEAKGMFYGLTGPAVSVKPSLNFNARVLNTDEIGNYQCRGGIDYSTALRLEAELRWDFAGDDNKLGEFLNLDKLEDAARFDIFDPPLEWPVAQGNINGYCLIPSRLSVNGDNFVKTWYYGSGEPVSFQYVLMNTGDYDIEWAAEFRQDGILSVSKTGGTLAGFQFETVDVTVDTSKLSLSPIPYFRLITFKNVTASFLLFPDIITGSKMKSLTVNVVPALLPPVLAAPVSLSPYSVNLSWTYPAGLSALYVNGYYIYQSKDDLVWELAEGGVVAEGGQTKFTVTNLLPDTVYYFRITAYDKGSKEYDPSNRVQIRTPKVQTGGDTVSNSLGMTFNRIPAGTFMMGSPSTEPGRDSDEVQHQVTLTNDFYMQTTEVTQKQWRDVTGTSPSYFSACGDNCPVEYVTWNDVQLFITEMNKKGEGTYRLPTEAEWEYAARAGSTTAFYNGAITYTGSTPLDPNLDAIGWYYGNSTVTYTPNSSGKGTHPVAQKLPNAYGLYDMSGNVWEWCQDWYGTYPTTAVTNPAGPGTGSYRVLRGGSWNLNAGYCRSAYRFSYAPSYRPGNLGFRLVLSPQVSR